MRLKLTDKKIRAAKAKPGQRLEFRDTVAPGLVLRVSSKGERTVGSKVWSFLYRRAADSKRYRVRIGTYPNVSLDEARNGRSGASLDDEMEVKGALQLRAEVEAGGHPAGNVAARKTELTFAQLAGDYIEKHAKKKKRSWKADRAMLDRDVIPVIGDLKVSEVRKHDVRDILEAIEGRGSPVAAARTFAMIRSVFRWAIGRDYVTANPCAGIQIEGPDDGGIRDRVLAPTEIQRFWSRLNVAGMEWRTQQILRLCLMTASRVGEVSGTAKSEVDLDAAVWEIPKERSKNKRTHRVPLSPSAVGLFHEAIERSGDSAFVFPGAPHRTKTDVAMTSHTVTKAVNRNQEHFGLERWTPHDLRRTAATNMGELGIARFTIAKVLNHAIADRGVTGQVYDKYEYLKEKRQALEVWAMRLQEIISDEQSDGKVVQFPPAS